MDNLNSVLLEGQLTAEPVLAYAPTGTPVCIMHILTKRYVKDATTGVIKEERQNYTIRTYNHQAEVCMEDLHQGRGIRVVGRLTTEEPGQIYIVAEHVELKPATKRSYRVPLQVHYTVDVLADSDDEAERLAVAEVIDDEANGYETYTVGEIVVL
jgi:single-strand DNA-binding protein